MSSAVEGVVKFTIPAQKATIQPPVGPLLAQRGLKAADFVKRFNDETRHFTAGVPVNAVLRVEADKTYALEVKSPSTSWFLKRACGVERCDPNVAPGTFNGSVSMRQIYEIARVKHRDPHLRQMSLQSVCKQVLSIARHCRLKVIP